MRLIDADELKKVFGYTDEWYKGRTICEHIDNAPTVVAENATSDRPQGEWITKEYSIEYYCSHCGERLDQSCENFCCHCGADMRGKK